MDLKELQNLTTNLKKLVADAHTDITGKKMPIDGYIDIGLELTSITKMVEKDLELVKISLREEALQRNNQKSGNVELRPSLCQVRIPLTKVELRKDADMVDLKAKTGPIFPMVFEEVTTYKPRKDFQELVGACDPAIQSELMGVVELKDPSPQVFFKAEQ